MNGDNLLDLIGEARGDYVSRAEKAGKAALKKLRRRKAVGFSALAAACAAVAVLGGFVGFEMGGNAGSGGLAPGESYMFYAGPIMPLSAASAPEGLSLKRNVNFDFSPYISVTDDEYERWADEAIVTDGYVISNLTENDITFRGIYPFVGDLHWKEDRPSISLNGETVATELYPGPYAGGFVGVYGDKNDTDGTINLDPYGSFENYETMLSDGTYMEAAFSEKSDLDIPVTVYRMGEYTYTSDESAEAPTLCMEFTMDTEKTSILTWNIDGASNDYETGVFRRHVGGVEFRPNADEAYREPHSAYIIVVGEDISSYSVQGYKNGGCRKGDELSDLGCTVTRYETSLGTLVKELIAQSPHIEEADKEKLFPLVSELLTTYGPLGEELVQCYDNGRLDDLVSEAYNHDRVIFAVFEVTVPAGASVELEAVTLKEASMDYVGKYKERNGYDMATGLGSVFEFSAQTASLSGYDEIEIIAQNFGFDTEAGIVSVELDSAVEHYWLEVVKIRN
ncbi:MAG: hypothetical protein IKZ19_10340 [Clostridia bacterium]|nr:hypothetical protein [Clostridia bacterium]